MSDEGNSGFNRDKEYAARETTHNIKAHEVVSETVKNSLLRATLFATIFSASWLK